MNLVDSINSAISLLPKGEKSAHFKKFHELEDLKNWLLERNIYSIRDLEKQFEFCLWIQERDSIKTNKYEKTK